MIFYIPARRLKETSSDRVDEDSPKWPWVPRSHIDWSSQYGSESAALEVAICEWRCALLVVQIRNDSDFVIATYVYACLQTEGVGGAICKGKSGNWKTVWKAKTGLRLLLFISSVNLVCIIFYFTTAWYRCWNHTKVKSCCKKKKKMIWLTLAKL